MSPEAPDLITATDETAAAALCLLTVEDWTRTLLDLLPRGIVWPREPGTVQEAFFGAIADEMVAIQTRDCALRAEAFPCRAVELLPDWEEMLGLPDECMADADTWPLAVRQRYLCGKLSSQGGQSVDYYVELAHRYGFDIIIREHFPWRMGCTSLCDARPGGCGFWWQVICPYVPTPPGAAVLECIIRRVAPAHTLVTFVYSGNPAVWNYGLWNIDSWRMPDG